MNQRNVDALDILINDFEGAPSKYGGTLWEFLASRGVLVLDVVTREEWSEVGSNFAPKDILESIAKGEGSS